MKKIIFPMLVLVTLLILSAAAQPVSAGVEPSPFQPHENEVLNMVKKLDVVQVQLERILYVGPGETKGIYKHRLDVVDDITQYLGGELYDGLVSYVRDLPADTTRGRNAAKVLDDGTDTMESIIATIEHYLRNIEGDPDRPFIAALNGLHTAAEETLPLMIEAWMKVGGVEPSPFKSLHVRIDDNDWDDEGQQFLLNISMKRGLANAGKHAGFEILITMDIVSVNGNDWDFIKLKIDDNGWEINDEDWDMTGGFVPIEPLSIPWDRDGGTFTGVLSVQTSASIIGPSGNVMGHPTVYTCEVEVGRDIPEIPPGGDSP